MCSNGSRDIRNSELAVEHYEFVRRQKRAVKQVNGQNQFFFNAGTSQLEAYDVSAGSPSSTIYEPGMDRPLAEVASDGTVSYYHQDVLGNVVMLTDSTGSAVESYSYDVWGKVSARNASGATVTSTPKSRFLFTGREYDAESGLYDYRARAYSPELGRFLQMDPNKFGGGDANIFRYVGNDPITWRDPLGLQDAGDASGGILQIPIDGIAIGAGLAIELWNLTHPSKDKESPKPAPKPKDCPPGTKPVDQAKLPAGVKPHDIKDWADQGATDWTGIAPNGDVIVNGPGGNAENLGPYNGNKSK